MKKRFIGLFIIISLMVNMLIPTVAFAATRTCVTIKNGSDGHVYEFYQIFSGDLIDDKLTNVVWGTGVKNTITSDATYGDVDDVVSGLNDESINATTFAKAVSAYLVDTPTFTITYSSTATNEVCNLDTGYYLMKDKDDSLDGQQNEAYTAYILKVVGDVEITPKTGVPSITLKTKETNDTTGVTSDWQDAADYDIGDDVPFQITLNVASNFDKYETYKMKAYVTQSSGYVLNTDSFVVKVGGTTIDSSNYTVTQNGNNFTIEFSNLVGVNGVSNNSSITIEYTSELSTSEDGVVTAYLEYSNNPNDSAKTGTTPQDKVNVFTYSIELNKVDDNNQCLTGAVFTIEKVGTSAAAVNIPLVANGCNYKIDGLDAGQYVIKETTAPEGHRAAADITVDITGTYPTVSDNPTLTSLTVSDDSDLTTISNDGSEISITLVNKLWLSLPSTGGVGAVIFIGAGVVLMGLVVFIIIKRRKKEDK